MKESKEDKSVSWVWGLVLFLIGIGLVILVALIALGKIG